MSRIQLPILVLLALLAICYALSSIGFIEMILFVPNRTAAIQQMDVVFQSSHPDIEYFLERVDSPDWFVAAVALERLGELRKSGLLSSKQSVQALETIFDNFGEHGHWWRFGWDHDEAAFNQYRSQVIDTASAFGSDLLPWLKTGSRDKNPIRRGAICSIVERIPNDSANEDHNMFLLESQRIVQELAEFDPDPLVVSTCKRVLQKIGTD